MNVMENLNPTTILYGSAALNIILLILVLKKRGEIRKLREYIAGEKKKREHPLLVLEKNPEDKHTYLRNNSYCYAKDIVFGELEIVVKYGFDKRLRIEIEPVEMLKPEEKVRLSFKVFDKDTDMTDESSYYLITNYADENFRLEITCTNLEGAAFTSVIGYRDKDFYLKESFCREEQQKR